MVVWVRVCVCVVFVCVFGCACVLARVHVCVSECVCMRVNAYVHTCVCVWCVYVLLFVCVWLCVFSYIDDNFDNALEEGEEVNIDDHGIPVG